MKYAKLINGRLQYAPNPLRRGDTVVINPVAEKLTELGYKAVTYTAPQGDAPEGFVWIESWTETEDAIVLGWELTPESDISPEEALDILLGGVSG